MIFWVGLLGLLSLILGFVPLVEAEKYRKYYHTTIGLILPWLEHKFKLMEEMEGWRLFAQRRANKL